MFGIALIGICCAWQAARPAVPEPRDPIAWARELARPEPARRGRAALALRGLGAALQAAHRRLPADLPQPARARFTALTQLTGASIRHQAAALRARIQAVEKDHAAAADRLLRDHEAVWRRRLAAPALAELAPAVVRAHVALHARKPAIHVARRELDAWLARNPADALAWIERASLLAHTGKRDAAVKACEQALAASPGAVRAVALRAELWAQARDPRAGAEADRAAGLAAVWPQALVVRARLHCGWKRPDRALADCDRALAIDPLLGEAYALRGRLHARAGHAPAAAADFRAALVREPWRAEAAAGLARICAKAGRVDQARAVLGETLAVADPDSVLTERAAALLDELKSKG